MHFRACRNRLGPQPPHQERLREIVALPALDGALSLTRVRPAYLRGLADLTPLRDAPAPRELELAEMQDLHPEDVAVLTGHGTLGRLLVGLGSDRKNVAVRDALRIAGDYGGHAWPVTDES